MKNLIQSTIHHDLHVGVCKMLRYLLDAILLLGNTLMIHKNTMHSHYVMLGVFKLEPNMSYEM